MIEALRKSFVADFAQPLMNWARTLWQWSNALDASDR